MSISGLRNCRVAGQDIYHGTHALFLRANAIFAVVWTPEFEKRDIYEDGDFVFRNYPLQYWIDYVRNFGGRESVALIVQTRCDNHKDKCPCPVSDERLKDAFNSGYYELLHFSAKTNRGLPNLKEKLREAVHHLHESQGVAMVGASRHRIKVRLEAMRDEDAKLPPNTRRHRWLTQEEFRQICMEEELLSEPAFLLDYLHNAGVIFYRDGLFDDRIILDQGWALEAVYTLFNRKDCLKQLRQLRGRFTRNLLHILVWRDYSNEEQQLFLNMMQSCGICFVSRKGDEQAGIETEYIAPELLPEKKEIQIDLDAIWRSGMQIETVEYTYGLLYPGLIRAITSRVGQDAGISALYWRGGLCVYEASTRAHALIEQEMDEGWSGRILLSTQGARALELLLHLQELIEEEQSRIGLVPRESPPRRKTGSTRPEIDENDKRKQLAFTFSDEPAKSPRYYVSYKWNDPSDRGQEATVDRLCNEANERGTPIIRDKTAMRHGDRISKFMSELAQGDHRVFILMSNKYLESPFCMFELFEIWRNCRQDEVDFKHRARLYVFDDAKIWTPIDRIRLAKYWKARYDELAAEIAEVGASLLSESDFRQFRLMQDFAHHVGDILSLVADTLLPRTFEDFVKYGFDDPI